MGHNFNCCECTDVNIPLIAIKYARQKFMLNGLIVVFFKGKVMPGSSKKKP